MVGKVVKKEYCNLLWKGGKERREAKMESERRGRSKERRYRKYRVEEGAGKRDNPVLLH